MEPYKRDLFESIELLGDFSFPLIEEDGISKKHEIYYSLERYNKRYGLIMDSIQTKFVNLFRKLKIEDQKKLEEVGIQKASNMAEIIKSYTGLDEESLDWGSMPLILNKECHAETFIGINSFTNTFSVTLVVEGKRRFYLDILKDEYFLMIEHDSVTREVRKKFQLNFNPQRDIKYTKDGKMKKENELVTKLKHALFKKIMDF